jgi:hypothetical protein
LEKALVWWMMIEIKVRRFKVYLTITEDELCVQN